MDREEEHLVGGTVRVTGQQVLPDGTVEITLALIKPFTPPPGGWDAKTPLVPESPVVPALDATTQQALDAVLERVNRIYKEEMARRGLNAG